MGQKRPCCIPSLTGLNVYLCVTNPVKLKYSGEDMGKRSRVNRVRLSISHKSPTWNSASPCTGAPMNFEANVKRIPTLLLR